MPESSPEQYRTLGSNKVQSQLDVVLDKLENVANQEKIEKQVFASKPDDLDSKPKSPKQKLFKDLGWYWSIIKKPVIFLAILEILTYILSVIPGWEELMLGIINPLLLIPYFIVFIIFSVQIKRKHHQSVWQAIVTLYLMGFGFGLVVAVFKAFWIREFWTIFNLIIEPVFMGLIAATVGFIVGSLVKRKRI